MKSIITLFFVLSILQLSIAQEWQEYFIHDRYSKVLDSDIYEDDLKLILNNYGYGNMLTVEQIDGNQTGTVLGSTPYYEWRSKSSQTGINEKQVILHDPFDYDINGWGVVGIRFSNDSTYFKHHFSEPSYITGYYSGGCYGIDAILPADTLETREILCDYENISIFDNNDILLNTIDTLERISFHEGLNGNQYAVLDSTFGAYRNGIFQAKLALPKHTKLYNDPYRNQLCVLHEKKMTTYDYETFQLISEHELDHSPLGLKFYEDGYKYLVNTSTNRIIYSAPANSATVTQTFISDIELPNYLVQDFQLSDDNVYYIGVFDDDYIDSKFVYVQKRSKTEIFSPVRNDIRIDSAVITKEPIGMYDYYKYNYTVYATNVGTAPINTVTLYSPKYPFANVIYFPIQNRKTELIEVGEQVIFEGDFELPEFNQMTLYIPGVDFGFDANPEDNQLVVDIESLSINDTPYEDIIVYPNPVTDRLSIDREFDKGAHYQISNINGHVVQEGLWTDNTLMVSDLNNNIYILQIIDETSFYRARFIKN